MVYQEKRWVHEHGVPSQDYGSRLERADPVANRPVNGITDHNLDGNGNTVTRPCEC